jgi:hypothetical protein
LTAKLAGLFKRENRASPVVLIYSTLVFLSAVFSSAAFAEGNPSKKATARFILGKIDERSSSTFLHKGKHEFVNDWCTLKILGERSGNGVDSYYLEWRAPLAIVSTKYIQSSEDGKFYLYLICESGDCINIRQHNFNGSSTSSGTNDIHLAEDNDGNYLNKINKAFIHLKAQCTGKKELF